MIAFWEYRFSTYNGGGGYDVIRLWRHNRGFRKKASGSFRNLRVHINTSKNKIQGYPICLIVVRIDLSTCTWDPIRFCVRFIFPWVVLWPITTTTLGTRLNSKIIFTLPRIFQIWSTCRRIHLCANKLINMWCIVLLFIYYYLFISLVSLSQIRTIHPVFFSVSKTTKKKR